MEAKKKKIAVTPKDTFSISLIKNLTFTDCISKNMLSLALQIVVKLFSYILNYTYIVQCSIVRR